ncbi:putative phloem protein [Helianthus anomalus]
MYYYNLFRFPRVPLMMDISNLNIQARIKAQLLSPSVIYGVYLVFKFVEPNIISSKPKYVNLMYKLKENETLHAYFATWRKDKWMMVELYRFLNKDGGDFEVLLESFSRCYCGTGPIYIEGIEFRAINNVTHEETEKSKDAQQMTRSNSSMGQKQQFPADNDETLELSENPNEASKLSNGKKHHMLSAKKVLYDSSNVKLFKLKPSEQSRFGEVIEVLSQQVFRIKCKIESQILSPDTDYKCYLIFKLSEKCRGLHSPVNVRGLHRPVKVEGQLQQSKKEAKAIYFRTPKEWNIHDINQVPKQREDGWMEVNVWKFNSKDQLRKDCIHLNLKLISYEGTMSGLIVCGLEFRPM